MNSFGIKFSFILCSVAALALAGCGDDSGDDSNGGAGNTGAGGGGSSENDVLLEPTADGWIQGSDTTLGVQGAWYPYSDATGEDPSCPKAGHTTCSVIDSPDPAVPGFPNEGGKMCTKGTGAQVPKKADGTPDWSAVWGTGIGIDFNNSGGDTPVKGTYDATAKGVIGIKFDYETANSTKIRVEFPIPATEGHADGSAYWGASATFPSSPVEPGENYVPFSEVKQPKAAVPFDPATLLGVQFHVPTNDKAPTPFDFCISNLRLVTGG